MQRLADRIEHVPTGFTISMKNSTMTCVDRGSQLDALFIISRVSASAIYFGLPFRRYPTFHALRSVGRKEFSECLENVAAISCYVETLFKPSHIFFGLA